MKISQPRIHGILCGLVILAVPAFAGAVRKPAPEPGAVVQETVSVIKEITYRKAGDTDRLVVTIKVEGSFQIETFALSGPKRLVIDFSPVSRVEAQPITQVNDTGLLNIRTGQFLPSVARLVFDLEDRVPSYSISSLPDGVRITFWQEAAAEPRERLKPVGEQKPALQAAAEPGVPGLNRPDLFLRVGPGMSLFFKPSFSVKTDFLLYGEVAFQTETHRQKTSPVFELSAGKLINPKFSAGMGVGYQMLWIDPALEGSLPHPFLPNRYREVAFETEDLTSNMWVLSEEGAKPRPVTRLRSGMWTVYAWGLYSLYQTEKVDLSAGPVVGFSFGKLYSLEDLELKEKAPYGAQDVTVASITFLENAFSKIDPGIIVSGTYILGDKLSAFASLRVHYVDVMVKKLQRRASLFRTSFCLGLEFGL